MALTVRSDDDLLAEIQTPLEQNAFPVFLQRQRWFGGKARNLDSVTIRDWQGLEQSAKDSAAQRRAVYFVLLDVRYTDGTVGQYFVPLSLRVGAAAESAAGSTIAELQMAGAPAVLADALADDDACSLFLTAVENQSKWTTRTGCLCGLPTAEFSRLRGPLDKVLPVRRGGAEQSNTNIQFGDRLMMKLFRRYEGGPHPDFEISRFLTERTSFQRVPRLAGGWLYEPRDGHLVTLAMLQGLVANDGNAWEQALEHLAGVLDQFIKQAADPSVVGRTLVEAYEPYAALLGQRTAELHLALASDADDPDFRPEPLSAADLARVSGRMRDHLAEVLPLLQTRLRVFPAGLRQQVEQLLAAEANLFARLQTPTLTEALTKIRCHGDYHLGQVLITPSHGSGRLTHDFVILDFEGEPTRPLAERRAKYSPLKDVAGMMRSFHYAAHAALESQPAERRLRLETWADVWQRSAATAFQDAYCAAAAGASFLPKATLQFRNLLDLYLLEKALYELHYELNNRPDWVGIPVQGLLAILADDASRP